jgi:hypothetical protein
MFLLLLASCSFDTRAPPQDVRFDIHEVRQVGGRFVGQDDTLLAPDVAFALQARCPRIDHAHLRQANDVIREITVSGAGLDQVTHVGAALYDKSLANAQFRREGDSLVFPVACNRCEVYLGVDAGGRTAACIGPGYSLSLADGQIVP